MKIEETYVRRLTISDVQGLDPIRVILEDIGPRQGRINIECYGKSWASYWGGMHGKSLAEFFCSCDEHYLAGYLEPSLESDIFDPEHLKESLKRTVIEERRKQLISSRGARKRFNTINDLDLPETESQLWGISRDLEKIIGEEWWYSIPKKTNPDYLYLCRIIKTVQEALKRSEKPEFL